jgi:hypothetical protein
MTTYKEVMEGLRHESEQIVEAECGENSNFGDSIGEKLGASTLEIQGLRQEFENLRNRQSVEQIVVKQDQMGNYE